MVRTNQSNELIHGLSSTDLKWPEEEEHSANKYLVPDRSLVVLVLEANDIFLFF